MAENSSTMMIRGNYPFIKGCKVVMASFGAMQIAAVFIKDGVPIEYYFAGAMLVVAFALVLIANSVPPGEELNTLAKPLGQVGIFLAVTSLFFSFSIFLPPLISVALLYWGAYLLMIVIIISCFYRGIKHSPEPSISCTINV